MAGIQEQMQQLNYLFSQANFTDKNHKKGPIAKPEQYPRPRDVYELGRKRAQEAESDYVEIPD